MGWRKVSFKGKTVWAEVDGSGAVVAKGGRVAIRYSDKEGAKLYRAGASGLGEPSGPTLDLAEGVSADAAKKAKKGSRGSGFGSAGSRTKAQAAMAAAAARELIGSMPETTILAFTDGSCRGNPGPAGSGAWVRMADGRVAEISKSLGHATNNVGELTAIGLVLDLLESEGIAADAPVALFTDSQYANGVLCKGWKIKANAEIIKPLKTRVLARTGLTVYWIAGHVGVDGNERADALAGAGVDGVSAQRWLD